MMWGDSRDYFITEIDDLNVIDDGEFERVYWIMMDGNRDGDGNGGGRI